MLRNLRRGLLGTRLSTAQKKCSCTDVHFSINEHLLVYHLPKSLPTTLCWAGCTWQISESMESSSHPPCCSVRADELYMDNASPLVVNCQRVYIMISTAYYNIDPLVLRVCLWRHGSPNAQASCQQWGAAGTLEVCWLRGRSSIGDYYCRWTLSGQPKQQMQISNASMLPLHVHGCQRSCLIIWSSAKIRAKHVLEHVQNFKVCLHQAACCSIHTND